MLEQDQIPEIVLIYLEWARANLLRPLLVMLAALLFWNIDRILYKLKLTLVGIVYFILCNDKSWKKPTDPAVFFDPILADEDKKKGLSKKTIIFIRHGESTWNETFNKGPHRSAVMFGLFFIPNLIKALLYEFFLFITGQMDSWFYDSPMSHYGLNQVESLHTFLNKNSGTTDREKELIGVLRGERSAPSSRIVTSGLRRASSTVAAGLRRRLNLRPSDSIAVIPSLQEISRNPDTLILTPARQQIAPSWIEKESNACDFQAILSNRFDMSMHRGNKPVMTNGLKRMNEFCKFAFRGDEEVLVCGGHSMWFRAFFRTFLPYGSDHVSKKRKMVNAGCVGFVLMKALTPQGFKYMIDPESVTVLYGGFA